MRVEGKLLTEHLEDPLGGLLLAASRSPAEVVGLAGVGRGGGVAAHGGGAAEAEPDQGVEDRDERHWEEEEDKGGELERVLEEDHLHLAGGHLLARLRGER